jgi:hypothetical protein
MGLGLIRNRGKTIVLIEKTRCEERRVLVVGN